ncbi:sigma-70 family RNA polymerase sigma factor [Microtetraspora malaysiensis]|uniref:sigma-70 family RNA polymerase sigma factor n=1 Tax=Microtetraspora malaysiensis TaxID=161358 RepID=UPI003D94D6ED
MLVRIGDVEHLEFEEFYQESRDACLRAVLATTGDRQLAEDLVAEAFTRAWMSWRKMSRHPAPHAWIVRVALNTRVTWWRRRRHEVALGGHDAVDPAAADGADVDPALLVALRRLPRRQREVVALRVFLDLDTETAARALGIAPGTVTAHLSRAVAALRGDLATVNSQEGER